MEAFPPGYVLHNLPFIALSGLGTAPELDPQQPLSELLPGHQVTTVNADIAALTSGRAQQLLQEFLRYDSTSTPWEAHGLDRRETLTKFRMRAVGRVGQAPAPRPTSACHVPTAVHINECITYPRARASNCPQRRLMLLPHPKPPRPPVPQLPSPHRGCCTPRYRPCHPDRPSSLTAP